MILVETGLLLSQVLMSKLIVGRAKMLAPHEAEIPDPIIDSARVVVAKCRDALPHLDEYEQRLRAHCTANIRMRSAVRDHQFRSKQLVDLESDIEQHRVELAIMRWMNADLLHAHELFTPLASQGATFEHAYLEMGLRDEAATPTLSAAEIRRLAAQATGRAAAQAVAAQQSG